ncbi:MAG: hypothetical protein ACM30H_03200 [Clostridia bacterium]
MRYFLCAVLAAAPFVAQAQQASEQETEALGKIAQCLAAGLPSDWAQAEMSIELRAPNAQEGEARYLVRRKLSGGAYEPFKPCDYKLPAQAMTDLRKLQPPERAGWTSARLVMHPDGKFEVTYDYPKK